MHLSFRGRLTLFFLLIVVLPMIAVGVLVVDVTGESDTGKADARLGQGLETAIAEYEAEVSEARSQGRDIADHDRLGPALASGNRGRFERVARQLARQRGVTSLSIALADGGALEVIPQKEPIAIGEVDLEVLGEPFGTMLVSTTTSKTFLGEVERLTGEDAVLSGTDGFIDGTLSTRELELPPAGEAADVEVDGEAMRGASVQLPDADGLRLTLLGEGETEGFFASSPRVAAALVIFFAIALVFVTLLVRALQGQVSTMLGAARRIGEGDFSREVPIVGRDEMAGLASEFNKMSGRLSEQMDQLRRQQVQIERSVQRIGEAFASGLDRPALLGIVVETAVGACDAEYGMVALSGSAGAEADYGEATDAMREAGLAAEERALRTREVVISEHEGAHALAGSLGRMGRPDEAIGVMTVVRDERPFSPGEHDVFRYLLGQASASVENLALHELVSQQAITDELTGLANKRAFGDLIEKEAARAERFGHDLSLLMLDIDDFKRVNDTHGHLQGDEVLRTIGRVLDSESRGVDEPARYGGEEFVVALPETDTDGALELAERIRARIEDEPVTAVGGGKAIGITASVGAATIPGSALDVQGLVAAADSALYEAKREGKNRVRAAPARPQPRSKDSKPRSRARAKGPTRARRT